jgi:hypothetical protein
VIATTQTVRRAIDGCLKCMLGGVLERWEALPCVRADSRSQYSPDPSVRHLRRPRTSSLSSLAADTTGRLDLGDSSPVGGSTVSIPALDTLARSLSQRSSLMDGDGDERVSTSHDDTGEPAAPEPSTSPRLGQREDRFRAEQEEPSERASLSQSYAGSSSATMPMLLQQVRCRMDGPLLSLLCDLLHPGRSRTCHSMHVRSSRVCQL